MTNRNNLSQFDEAAIETCVFVVKDLIRNFDEYKLNTENLNSLSKALYTLQNYPENKMDGCIDISASSRWDGGGLDYCSFTVAGDYIEISAGGITYNNGTANDSYSEQVYSSAMPGFKSNLPSALKCWLESFYLHIKDNGPKAIYINDMAIAADEEFLYSNAS